MIEPSTKKTLKTMHNLSTMKTLICLTFLLFVQSAMAETGEKDAPLPPPMSFNPGPKYADADREFQGIASIAPTPGGRLWATWYGGGKGEGPENYIMLATSGDSGDTWSDLKLVVDPPFRASEPGIWCDPTGRLWLMLNLYPEGLTKDNSQMWVITTDNPDDEDPNWSEPRLIATGLNNFNEPIVLEDGTWLWPTGDWRFREPEHPSRPLLSTDGGQSFQPGGALRVPPEVRQFDEYNVVQLRDGRLWLLNRTKAGIYEAYSSDGGQSWTEQNPHPVIRHAVTRHFLTRLKSGRLNGFSTAAGQSLLTAEIITSENSTARHTHLSRNLLVSTVATAITQDRPLTTSPNPTADASSWHGAEPRRHIRLHSAYFSRSA